MRPRSPSAPAGGEHRVDLRQLDLEQAEIERPLQRLPGAAALEQLHELFGQARGGGAGDLATLPMERLLRPPLHAEAEAAGELAGPHHPHRILAEAHVRVADRPDQPRLEVVETARVVEHRVVGDVVERGR